MEKVRLEEDNSATGQKSLFLLWFKTQKDYRHFLMDK